MVRVFTLGCKLNQYDSARLSSLLENLETDLVILNTCAVTKNAEDEAKKILRRLKRQNPTSKIVAFGCGVKASKEDFLKIKEVDHLFENEESLLEYFSLNNATCTLPKFDGKTRGLIKIQEGCNRKCSYCIVPFLRGKSKSRDLKNIKAEVEKLLKSGFKEIVLTGTNIGDYGIDLKNSLSLKNVIEEILKMEGNFRIRLSSLDPHILDDEFIKLIKENSHRICRHLHISIQSGSKNVLKAMRRDSNTERLSYFIKKIYNEIPSIAIGCDIICGFPTESEEDFLESLNFLSALPVHFYHIFTYSRRKNTESYTLPILPRDVVYRRRTQFLQLKERKRREFLKDNEGKEFIFLTLESKDDYGRAISDNYIEAKTLKKYPPNNFVKMSLKLKDGFEPFAEEV